MDLLGLEKTFKTIESEYNQVLLCNFATCKCFTLARLCFFSVSSLHLSGAEGRETPFCSAVAEAGACCCLLLLLFSCSLSPPSAPFPQSALSSFCVREVPA